MTKRFPSHSERLEAMKTGKYRLRIDEPQTHKPKRYTFAQDAERRRQLLTEPQTFKLREVIKDSRNRFAKDIDFAIEHGVKPLSEQEIVVLRGLASFLRENGNDVDEQPPLFEYLLDALGEHLDGA